MPFSGLPLELKQAIWDLALHAAVAEPEVCIIWPLHHRHYDPAIWKPLLVDTAFPVLMHVCREWRDFVLYASQRPSSPVRFRFSRLACCRVPFRAFRPSTDALYASSTNFENAVQCLGVDWEPGVTWPTLRSVRHLAVEWLLWMKTGNWLNQLVYRACPDLKKVSVAFPSSRRGVWKAFQAPARRCKLRLVEGADRIMGETLWKPGEMVSMQWHVDYGRMLAEDEAMFAWQYELDVHEMEMGEPGGEWFVGTAWDKEREVLCLEYEAAAFAQYKRSGDGTESWIEACEDRLLERAPNGKFQEPPIPGPEKLRLNREEWRVNDEDDYLF